MPYRLRGFIQIALLRARLRPQYLLAGLGLGLSLVLAVAQPPWVAGWPLVLLSIACLVLALTTFWLDTRALWEAGRRSVLSVVEAGPRIDAMKMGDACHDYAREAFHGRRYAYDPEVDRHLATRDVPLVVREGRSRLPAAIEEHAPAVLAAKFRRGVALFNSRSRGGARRARTSWPPPAPARPTRPTIGRTGVRWRRCSASSRGRWSRSCSSATRPSAGPSWRRS